MSEIELSISLPLDSEGFLRRACPSCGREFKWKASSEDDETTPSPKGGYSCPYCGQQASPDVWWTAAQIEVATAHAYREVVSPELHKLADSMGQSSGGLLNFEVEVTEPQNSPDLEEPDDMRRVNFDCHREPVKVSEEWQEAVHCPICGKTKAL